MTLSRLDKILGDMGIASRKELKEIIRQGRVKVDGVAVTRPETKLDPEQAELTLDGETLGYSRYHYFMLDKPCGLVTATRDKKQKTVLDLLSPQHRRMGLFPVGRLDKDTSGLLLLTDDGEFAHRVISPKSCVEKRYYAQVEGEIDSCDIAAFKEGLILADSTRCLPAGLEPIGPGQCIVSVMEGKYHQVRRMLASRGKPVRQLRRLSIGLLELDEDLGAGGYRELSREELEKVFG